MFTDKLAQAATKNNYFDELIGSYRGAKYRTVTPSDVLCSPDETQLSGKSVRTV